MGGALLGARSPASAALPEEYTIAPKLQAWQELPLRAHLLAGSVYFFADWVITAPLQGFVLIFIFCVRVDYFFFFFSGILAGVLMPGRT